MRRKKIANREEAKNVVKQVNESAKKIAEEVLLLSSQLNELKDFTRVDSEQYKHWSNAHKVRNASSEFIRLDRKLTQILPILKVLAVSRYPEPIIREEDEEDFEEELINKIDKSAKPLKSSIMAPPKDETKFPSKEEIE